MYFLTEDEAFAWLRERDILIDPYHSSLSGRGYYLQFQAPAGVRVLDAFTRLYFQRVIGSSEALLHLTDWSLYTPIEMGVIAALRVQAGERRPVIEAPGQIIVESNATTGMAIFSHAAAYGWTAYLYSAGAKATLYNWEGDIFDFWTPDEALFTEMRSLIREFQLGEIAQPKTENIN